MDRVVTSLLVIDEQGNVEEQAGSFSDWEHRGGTLLSTVDEARNTTKASKNSDQPKDKKPSRPAVFKPKLSYKEQRELDELPGLIASLEEQQARLDTTTSNATFFNGDPADVAKALEQLTQVGESLDTALERLIELEG